MPQELFRSEESSLNQIASLTRVVTRRDDGKVVIALTDSRVIDGTPVNEVVTSIEFTAAEWVTLTAYPFSPPPYRVISLGTFLERITLAELTAFEALKDADRTARAWWGKLMARGKEGVNLDSQELINGLAFVKTKALDPATPVDQRVWADTDAADSRIAVIRA